jgi:hypothetical protein
VTTSPALARLHARVRQQRARIVARRWEYRQRDAAKGVWPKLCRTLADAAQAYAISEADLAELLAEGHILEPSGSGFEPKKCIVFVSVERAQALPSRRELALHLSGELLVAQRLALVRFA